MGGKNKGEGELIRVGRMVPYPGDLKYTGRGEGNRGQESWTWRDSQKKSGGVNFCK